jgi:hypothetical protein
MDVAAWPPFKLLEWIATDAGHGRLEQLDERDRSGEGRGACRSTPEDMPSDGREVNTTAIAESNRIRWLPLCAIRPAE